MPAGQLVRVLTCLLPLASTLCCRFELAAQTAESDVQAHSAPRVLTSEEVDASRQFTLRGNTHPLANRANDVGSAPAGLTIHRMLVQLRRAPEQEAALAQLVDMQQDPSSAAFHKWLSPEQFGTEFGPAPEDVQKITSWLSSHGFSNIVVNKGRDVIEFSGTAGQVQNAFHTEIHRYEVNGKVHFANDRDPSIPVALAPVVVGIVSLNDFGRSSMVVRGPTLRTERGEVRPQIVRDGTQPDITLPGSTLLSTFFGLAPYDFATVYDLLPLWNQGLDGTGQTIAVIGETQINPSDPKYFREFFGLPANDPSILIAGADPGFQPDEIESDLDVEWAGAVAKGAHVVLVSAASTETTAGVDLAALYAIDNNIAPVISESYGACELFIGTAGNAFEKAMWQQAAAEGITVLVSSGDQGSAGCDITTPTQNLAVHPMAVNGLASTPYNVAVGGTDFNQYNNWTTYWNTTNDPTTKQSVLSYIPEIPWNDSCGSSILDAITGDDPTTACNNGGAGALYLNTIASSGGPSSCVSSDGNDATSCTAGWPKPIWQAGKGVPADGVRDVPDVSLFAGNGVYNSAYVICDANAAGGKTCDPSAAKQYFIGIGGTSASAPAMAGVMAIINQKYGRQGNANYTLYRLASSPQAASIFHDVTADNNRVACNFRSPDCEVPVPAGSGLGRMKGHDSTVGYDMVTGLGSIDIANLVNNWASATYTATKTTLDLNGGVGTVTAQHGAAVSALVNVSASAGIPTGDVSLLGTTANGSIYLGSLQSGSTSGTVNDLPGGNYSVSAHYAGDTQFAPSDSTAVNVSISPEPSSTKLSVLNYDVSTGLFSPTAASEPYGNLLLIRADVKGQSGFGNATGSVDLTSGTDSLGTFSLNAEGYTEDIPSNLLLGGTHVLKAAYRGDSSFNASTSATSSVTITPGPMACTLGTNTVYVRPGWVVVITPDAGFYQAKLAPALGTMVAPTGTMSIYSGSTLVSGPTAVTGHGSATLDFGAFELPNATTSPATIPVSQLSSPTAPITIKYSGDSNYAGCTSDPLVLTYDTSPVASQVSFTLSSYLNVPQGTPLSLSASVQAANSTPAYEPDYPVPTGTVQLVIDGVNVGAPVQLVPSTQPLSSDTGVANFTFQTNGLSLGNHAVNLNYGGDSNYHPSISGQGTVSIVLSDFSVSLNPSSLTITNGQSSGPTSVQLNYASGFAGTTTFSCSGLPAEASCVFTPSTLPASGTTTLTITTTKAQFVTAGNVPRAHPRGWAFGGGVATLGFVVLCFVPRRGVSRISLIFVGSVALLFGISSCGGGGSGGSGIGNPSKFSTSTSVTASSSSPAKGAQDTFTAKVAAVGSNATPTGTVQFAIDGATSGSAVALTNGSAPFQTSFSTGGVHTVSASYSGDTSNLASQSTPLTINVPYNTGSIPGTYAITVSATSGTVTHSATLTLVVQ